MVEAIIIDPSRIADRLFSGCHFIRVYKQGDTYTSLCGTEVWSASEIAKAWNESRNIPRKAKKESSE